MWVMLVGWLKGQVVGKEAYLLHRVSCTVPGARSTPSGGGGGVWTSGAGKGMCGAGPYSCHRLLLPQRCYSCHHPQLPHSLPDLSPEKFYHLSEKESRHKSTIMRHTRQQDAQSPQHVSFNMQDPQESTGMWRSSRTHGG